ncbi:hypothetical protein [Micromonospora zamorensis]|uniref:Uncharacterized protein n=1 Tax=Micromonospora zamorensis TaxID=709883 RepID=A0ABZ1PNU4_9ACTN
MRDRIGQVRINPYHSVRSFWGEELSTTLVNRIAGAPQTHIDRFAKNEKQGGVGLLPELPTGHLRPVFSVNESDRARVPMNADPDGAFLFAAQASLVVLLYAHQVVVDNPFNLLVSNDPEVRRAAGKWLLDVQPLFDSELVHFAPITSVKIHPSSYSTQHLELGELIWNTRDQSIESWIRSQLGPAYAANEDEYTQERYDQIASLVLDVLSHGRYLRSWPGKIHRLLRSQAEQSVLRIAMKDSALVDQRALQLRKLLELGLPDFAPDAKTLVSMRQDEEVFADWRHHLSRALDAVDILNPQSEDEMTVARSSVQGEMDLLRRRVESAATKSPAIQSLRAGSTSFGISAVAAGAAFAVGGSLPTALASAIVTKGLEGVMSYAKAKREQPTNRAILDLTLLFEKH